MPYQKGRTGLRGTRGRIHLQPYKHSRKFRYTRRHRQSRPRTPPPRPIIQQTEMRGPGQQHIIKALELAQQSLTKGHKKKAASYFATAVLTAVANLPNLHPATVQRTLVEAKDDYTSGPGASMQGLVDWHRAMPTQNVHTSRTRRSSKIRRGKKKRGRTRRGGASEANIMWVFNKINTSGSGEIDFEEIEEAIDNYRSGITPRDLHAMVLAATHPSTPRCFDPLPFNEFKKINNGFRDISNDNRITDSGQRVPGDNNWNRLFNATTCYARSWWWRRRAGWWSWA